MFVSLFLTEARVENRRESYLQGSHSTPGPWLVRFFVSGKLFFKAKTSCKSKLWCDLVLYFHNLLIQNNSKVPGLNALKFAVAY